MSRWLFHDLFAFEQMLIITLKTTFTSMSIKLSCMWPANNFIVMPLPFNIVFASSVENFWSSWSCWLDQTLPKTQYTQALAVFIIRPGKIITTTSSLSATLWLLWRCLWYSIGHSFLCSFLCFFGGLGLSYQPHGSCILFITDISNGINSINSSWQRQHKEIVEQVFFF